MKKQSDKKLFFFVDESGDPNFIGRKNKNLIATGKASKYFMVGHIELENPNQLAKDFTAIRGLIKDDDYLNQLPSISSSLRTFHANKDSREVQERVFRVLKKTDFSFFSVVIEKKLKYYKSKFNGSRGEFYSYIVERLLESRLHAFKEIDIYFSKMDNVTHEGNMWNAIEKAKQRFSSKWDYKHENRIRIFMHRPSQIAGLQAVDYCLWALHRVYNHDDFRYFNFLREKISLVLDLSYGTEFYGTYFSKQHPLTKERFIKKKSPNRR